MKTVRAWLRRPWAVFFGCLALTCCARAVAAVWRVTPVGEILRFTGPEDLSSITWIGGGVYAAVSDSDGSVAKLDIGIDPKTGVVTRYRCVATNRLEGVRDGEGSAYDRFSGRLWVADEAGAEIVEHDLAGGGAFRRAPVPECYRGSRANLGLESLAISPDGLSMWTCNEETLFADGARSSKKRGALVRITKFVRNTPSSNWRAAGQWIYRTGRIVGDDYKGVSASGVSDLCVAPDGTLLTLEREMSKGLYPKFRARIYEVDFTGATDVLGKTGPIDGPEIVRAKKTKLFEEFTGRSNYEGFCFGPELEDGSRVLLLVSDGDGWAAESVYSLRLSRASRPLFGR